MTTDPLQHLDNTTHNVREHEHRLNDARLAARAAVLAALRAGARPNEVARRSPFSYETVRRLARDAGIEGNPSYVRDVRGTTHTQGEEA